MVFALLNQICKAVIKCFVSPDSLRDYSCLCFVKAHPSFSHPRAQLLLTASSGIKKKYKNCFYKQQILRQNYQHFRTFKISTATTTIAKLEYQLDQSLLRTKIWAIEFLNFVTRTETGETCRAKVSKNENTFRTAVSLLKHRQHRLIAVTRPAQASQYQPLASHSWLPLATQCNLCVDKPYLQLAEIRANNTFCCYHCCNLGPSQKCTSTSAAFQVKDRSPLEYCRFTRF